MIFVVEATLYVESKACPKGKTKQTLKKYPKRHMALENVEKKS